jgi:hypothetical protein
MLMGSLAFKILVGYWVAGVVLSIPLAHKKLGPLEQSNSVPVFVGRVLLYSLFMGLFWPVVVLILLDDEYQEAKKTSRSIYDRDSYYQASDAEKVRRLLKVYKVFKRYRPYAREEKLLKATASVYFEVMRWKRVQVRGALNIIEPRIGKGIVSLKDLTKAILVLEKPWLGRLSDSGYEEKFRAAGEIDRMIESVLSEISAKVVRIYG